MSVSLYAFMLMLVLVCCLGRYSLYNPIFIYCLLQLTIYSINWISSIAVVNFRGDTLWGLTIDNTNNAIAKYFLISSLWLFVATLTYSLSKGLTNWQAKDHSVNYKSIGLIIVFISLISFLLVLQKFDSLADLLIQRQLTREDRVYAEEGRHFFLIAQSGILGLLFWALYDENFYKDKI